MRFPFQALQERKVRRAGPRDVRNAFRSNIPSREETMDEEQGGSSGSMEAAEADLGRTGDDIMIAILRSLNDGILGFNTFAALRERFGATLDVWQKRIETRRELAELSFRDIQDIGIDQAYVEHEIAKPFWQA
jgi:uncharacterized protein YjiS (DUF1127 family)